jgi:hypothetical protein
MASLRSGGRPVANRRPIISRRYRCAKPNNKALDASGKSGAMINIIAEIVTPAPGNRQRVFCSVQNSRSGKFQFVELISLHFLQFVDISKNS